jgi:small subunit ribosomal protein S20
MPVLKHAKKKLRQDKRRTADNLRIKEGYKKAIKLARKNPTIEAISKAFSNIDKAAKQNIIHENKAARLKAALSKVPGTKSEEKEKIKKTPKQQKTSKKTAKTKKTSK